MILYLLFWVGLIVGLIYLVIRFARRAGPVASSPFVTAPASALEIAQLRYARGEIDRETYLKLVEDLR